MSWSPGCSSRRFVFGRRTGDRQHHRRGWTLPGNQLRLLFWRVWAGLLPGVTRRDLIRAVHKGREYALELSPVIYQQYERGFFVPAGIPHRPGTALTLEIQQPSDVYTLLETHSGGKRMSPQADSCGNVFFPVVITSCHSRNTCCKISAKASRNRRQEMP